MDRYEAHGIPYEMEEDKVVIAGPSWLEFGLKYEPVMNGDQTGKVHNRYRDFRGFSRPRTSEPESVVRATALKIQKSFPRSKNFYRFNI